MINTIGNNVKRNDYGLISRTILAELRRNKEKTATITGNPGTIQTRNLTNTSYKYYHFNQIAL
jgi:hypothetical protein